MVIICPACRGAGHVEGNDCRCNGWGRLKVQVVGPCDIEGNVRTDTIEEWVAQPENQQKLLRKLKVL